MNCWTVGQLLQSSSSILNSCCCNLLLLAILCHGLNLFTLPLVVIIGDNNVIETNQTINWKIEIKRTNRHVQLLLPLQIRDEETRR